MSTTIYYDYIYLALISCMVGISIYFVDKREKSYTPKGDAPLYAARVSGASILYFPFSMVVGLRFYLQDAEAFLNYFVTTALLLTTYLAIFLMAMSMLRKILQANSCAELWSVLLIQLLFIDDSPKWAIILPFSAPSCQIVQIGFWIWIAGAVITFLFHIVRHFLFRHQLLKNATPLDGDVHALFQKWVQIANIPAGYLRAVRSPAAKTPVSIGLFRKTTYLVLPEKDYTPEELALIFQHEIIHISRKDSLLKFNLLGVASLLWFHPLVWIALKRCAADLELSCDEAVMYGRPREVRQKYASLLLDTACPSPGFTSCLSASAGALRYRLKNIVRPKKRMVGGLFIGILCFALALLSVHITVRFAPAPAKEQIFHGEALSQIEITQVMSRVDGADKDGYSADRELLTYIGGLSLAKTGEKPDVYEFVNHVQIDLRSPTHGYCLTFGGNYLRVYSYDYALSSNTIGRTTTNYYYLESQPDWALLRDYIIP